MTVRLITPIPCYAEFQHCRIGEPVTRVIVNDACCLSHLQKGGLIAAICDLPNSMVIPLTVRESEVLQNSKCQWNELDMAGMITHDLTPKEVG